MCVSYPGRVVEMTDDGLSAVVESGGRRRSVSLSLFTLEGRSLAPGDWVLVNAGFAYERIDPHEGRELERLREEAGA